MIACGGDRKGEERANSAVPAYPDGPSDTRVIRFAPVPRRVTTACRSVANTVAAPFPCPRVLPRATRAPTEGAPVPAPRVELVRHGSGLSIEYGAPPLEGEPPPGVEVPPSAPWQIRPCCFFHATFELPRARPSFPAEDTRIAGREGFLSTAPGPRFTMYQDHTQFTFRSGKRWSWVTVHAAGSDSATRLVLDRIVANLEPVSPTR